MDKVLVLECIEFIMFHALEQPADGLITLDNHLQVQRMVNPCFGDSFGALPTRTSTHRNTHTHTHTQSFSGSENDAAFLGLCLPHRMECMFM